MKSVIVNWANAQAGGRKTPFPGGLYYPIAIFPNDDRKVNSWSVVLKLSSPKLEMGQYLSVGTCRYLSEDAPSQNFDNFKCFDIYEGPRKVASVAILKHQGVG